MANTKIYNMASNDVVIATYQAKPEKGISGENKIKSSIILKGKANVRDPKTGQTPKFSATEVTAEELKVLEANPSFVRKVKAGYISVGKEPVALKADKSAQLTEDSKEVKSAKAKGAAVKTNTNNDDE